jgi:hypothetical protein
MSMFFDMIRHVLWCFSNIYHASYQPLFHLSLLAILASTYLIWRLWRFVIVPALNPREPKVVSYYFPGM